MKKVYFTVILGATISIGIFFYFVNHKNNTNLRSNIQTENSDDALNSQVLSDHSKEIIKNTDNSERVKVTRVIDGDTIEIVGGQKVRYIGIDTPETSDPRKPVQCFAKEASEKNKELVEGKEVSLEKDITEADKYGRLLRYVYVDDIFINDYLVRQGYAFSYTYPPDVKYQEQFTYAEKEARENQKGLWSSCLKNPEDESLAVMGPNGCQIKGNISSKGEKIYHMPGQKYYDKTQINESKGERWFCSKDEAIESGWRKSKI